MTENCLICNEKLKCFFGTWLGDINATYHCSNDHHYFALLYKKDCLYKNIILFRKTNLQIEFTFNKTIIKDYGSKPICFDRVLSLKDVNKHLMLA